MKYQVIILSFIVLFLGSCQEKKQQQAVAEVSDNEPSTAVAVAVAEDDTLVNNGPFALADYDYTPSATQNGNLEAFVPEGFILMEKVYGDLNNNGSDDCVLIIKGTDKEYIVEDEYRGTLDQNRRGIIIAFAKINYYEVISSNLTCFSSENEDGGAYFAPELSVEIERNVLKISYMHGRCGHWGYTFRYQNNAFLLIGYESHSNRGPVRQSITSINFSTNKKKYSVNLNGETNDDEPEIWEDAWSDIEDQPLIDIKDISDFDTLYFEKL